MGEYLVVGSGLTGSVCARELAEAGHRVTVLERRDHFGGNVFDEVDRAGLLVHRYGPHIFHTNSAKVVDYLSRFTAWRPYEHRVLAVVDGREYPFPINLLTLNQLYGLELDEAAAASFLERVREPRPTLATSEDVVLAAVGRDLYEKFYLNYTRKQWGLHPSQLKASVAARIPVRTNADTRYFTDRFQAMPRDGYTALIRNLLDHPGIRVDLGVEFDPARMPVTADHVVFTGPIDAYFGHCLGRLPYRSLRFEHEHLPDVRQFQAVAQVNYPNDHAFTRVIEFKHLTGQQHPGTSIMREYPQAEGEPFYPVPQAASDALFKRYEQLAVALRDVTFVGRLAHYRYYNMDQAVAAALTAVARLTDRKAAGRHADAGRAQIAPVEGAEARRGRPADTAPAGRCHPDTRAACKRKNGPRRRARKSG
jgi:UDP-galactopyranose mutase